MARGSRAGGGLGVLVETRASLRIGASRAPSPVTEQWVSPLFASGDDGQSILLIQNTDPMDTASVRISIRAFGDPLELAVMDLRIPPSQTAIHDFGVIRPALPFSPFRGSALVTSDRAVAIQSLVAHDQGEDALAQVSALTGAHAGASLRAPVVRVAGTSSRRVSTSIHVVNPASTAVEVRPVLRPLEGGTSCAGLATDAAVRVIPPRTSERFEIQPPSQVESEGRPYACFAAMRLEATGPIMASVLEVERDRADGVWAKAAGYLARPDEEASTSAVIPLVWKESATHRRTTAIAVSSVSLGVGSVTLRYFDGQGNRIVCADECELSLPAGSGRWIDLAEVRALPRAYFGHVELESDVPFVAVAVHSTLADRDHTIHGAMGAGPGQGPTVRFAPIGRGSVPDRGALMSSISHAYLPIAVGRIEGE